MRKAPTVTHTLLLAWALCVAAEIVLAESGRSETRASRAARPRPLAAG
jgi:hypothetical protein